MRFFVFALLFIFSIAVKAQLGVYEMTRPTRSLGMGGVIIPIVNDGDAVFYNPAALANVKNINLQLADIEIAANGEDAYKIAQDVKNIDDPATQNSLFGKRLYAQASDRTSIATRYFGLGIYTEYNASLQLHNPAYPQVDTYFRNDTGVVMGGAIPLGTSTSIGLTLKQIRRWGGYEQDLGAAEMINLKNISSLGTLFQNKGTGYGADAAFMTTFDAPLKPTFATVLQDIGDTSFTETGGTAPPPRIQQNLSTGLSAGAGNSDFGWTVAVEARHLLESDIQIGNKLHVGAELSLALLDLRVGMNQGYLTYGAGINFYFFRLDAASYGEELGAYPGQIQDNRIQIGLTMNLNFDADFNFTDNDRKTKQRR